jgi:hypothetical protein
MAAAMAATAVGASSTGSRCVGGMIILIIFYIIY